MGCYPGVGRVIGKCTRKKLLGKICGGDIVEIVKARTTANGELLPGPGLLAGYQCLKCKKKSKQPPFSPRPIEALGL